MKKYIGKRLLISLATLLVILLVLFVMMDLMPGSPFNDEKLTEAQKALLYAKYGLDQPFLTRFITYLKNMLTGDFGVSVPSYVFALLLCYFIAYKLGLFPILYNAAQQGKSLVLPAIALSFSPTANIARFTRSEMLDVLNSDYILLVKSKGLKDYKVILKHAMRNSLIPIVTIMGPILVGLLTGSSVVEKVFGIPGLGTLLITAIQSNDYNVTIACAFVYSLMYIVAIFVVDVLYGVIDPRIRVAKEGGK